MSTGNLVSARLFMLLTQSANEVATTDEAKLFAKNVAGVSQLFGMTSDGTPCQITPVGSTCEMSFYACDDFVSSTVSNGTVAGSANVVYGNGVAQGAPGVVRQTVVAVTTPDASCLLPATNQITSITFGANLGRFIWECRSKTATAVQDGTNQWSDRFGCGDSTTTDATDGIYFESDRAVNGDNNVRLCAASGGTRTKTSMGVAPTIITFERWRFVVDAAGTSVQGYFNNTATGAAVTTNIPTSGACAVWWLQVIKTLGATTRNIERDYVEAILTFDKSSRATPGDVTRHEPPPQGDMVAAHIVSLLESSADPATEIDEVQGYAKDVSTVSQLFAREDDGTPTQISPVSGLCSMCYYGCDDFYSSTVSNYLTVGTGTNVLTTAVQGAPGVVRQTVAAVADNARLVPNLSQLTAALVGGGFGGWYFEGRCRTNTAQDGTDQWSDRWGCGDGTTGDSTDGIYFESDRAVNGDNNVRLCTSLASVRTKTSMGVAPTAGTFERWKFICNAGGTSVQGYLNDTATGAAVTSNLPTTGTFAVWWAQVIKTLGTTARTIDRDYVESYQLFTSPR